MSLVEQADAPGTTTEHVDAPGYVMRSMHLLFNQGDREPWTHLLEYAQQRTTLLYS